MTTVNDKKIPSMLVISDGMPASQDCVRSAIRLATATGSRLDILVTSDRIKQLPEDEIPANTHILKASWAKLPSDLRHVAVDLFQWLQEEGVSPMPQTFLYKKFPGDRRRIFWHEETQNIRIWISHDEPYDAARRLHREQNFDIIAVRGRSKPVSWLDALLNRDLATLIARELPASTLVVKAPIYIDSSFVVCTNSPDASHRSMSILKYFINNIKKAIDIIIDEGTSAEELSKWLAKNDKEGQINYLPAEMTDVVGEIEKYIQQNQVLVIGSSLQAKSWLSKRLQGTTGIRLIRKGNFSVLLSKEIPDSSLLK